MAPFDRSFYIIFIFEIHDMNYGKLIFLLELTWNDPAVFKNKNKKENKEYVGSLFHSLLKQMQELAKPDQLVHRGRQNQQQMKVTCGCFDGKNYILSVFILLD